MATVITNNEIKDLLKDILGTVAYDYDNLVKNGTDGMKSYLADAQLPEQTKAEMYANFLAQTMTTSIQASVMLAGDIAKANAEFNFRSNDVLKSAEELNILREQLKHEQYKTTNMLPAEYAILQKDALLKAELITTESAKQSQLAAETTKISAEKLLIDSQKAGEDKKNAVSGVIDQQAELYKQQGISFKGHNLSKSADSIAQIVGMIVAEGAVPATGIVTAHAKCVAELASLSGTTLTSYTTVK